MKYAIALALLFFAAVFQASAMAYAEVLGVRPDLLLILVASWAMVRGQGEAMAVVPLAGLMRDLTSSDPLGTSVLALSPIAVMAVLREFKPIESDFLPTLAVVIAGTIAYWLLSLTVLTATGYGVPWLDVAPRLILPAAMVNALFTPILYLPLRWLSRPDTSGRPLGPAPGPAFRL